MRIDTGAVRRWYTLCHGFCLNLLNTSRDPVCPYAVWILGSSKISMARPLAEIMTSTASKLQVLPAHGATALSLRCAFSQPALT